MFRNRYILSLSRQRRGMMTLKGCYQQPAYRLATDLGVGIKGVSRVYQHLRQSAKQQASPMERRGLPGCPKIVR